MKEIIYLNTDFMNSFMAQTFKGLPIGTTEEHLQQDTETSQDNVSRESTHHLDSQVNSGSIQIPMIVMSPNGSISYRYSNGKRLEESISLTQVDAGKEIISKKLHDNALNEFINYLNSEGRLTRVDWDEDIQKYLGKYIEIKSTFSIFDLDSVNNLVSPSILLEIIKLISKQQFGPYRGTGSKAGKNQNANQELKAVENGMKLFELITEYLGKVLPSKIFFKLNGFVAPIKKEYLRESSSELNFKYGKGSDIEITVIGRATKIFNEFAEDVLLSDGSLKDVATGLREVVDMVSNEIKSINKDDVIVSPIAIYFE